MKAGTTRTLRRRNVDSIVTIVQRNGTVTRTKISQLTGLSVPTVTRVVTELIQRGVLKEVDRESSPVNFRPGRPATQVTINPASGYIIGVGIREHQMQIAVADVTGKIMASSHVATLSEEGGYLTLHNMLRGLEENLLQVGVQPKEVTAIAVGVPGTIDQRKGMVLDAPNIHGWRNFNLRNAIQEHYPTAEILVENDVNYAALGEFNAISTQPDTSLVFLAFRKGIGAGIILNGHLYRGASGLAGEVGFMALGQDFHYDANKGLGHLETIAGEESLLAQLGPKRSKSYETLEDLFVAAQQSQPEALTVVKKALGYYAVAVANVATFLDPNIVVIGGDLCAWPGYTLTEISRIVHQLIPTNLKITMSQLGHQATLYGALSQAKITAQRSLVQENVRKPQ